MSEELARRLGLVVRRARTRLGLSQEEFAEVSGLDRAYVSGLERGTRNPTLVTLERVAHGLDLPLHELIRRAGEIE